MALVAMLFLSMTIEIVINNYKDPMSNRSLGLFFVAAASTISFYANTVVLLAVNQGVSHEVLCNYYCHDFLHGTPDS